MSKLSITAAFGDYDRTVPLRTGDACAAGIDLRVLTMSPTEIFSRMCQRLEFDASEMSMGAHLYLTAAGDSPFVGMPAFPSRAFRHSMVYAHVDSGIEKAEDLNGKRIAIREWGMTAVLWIVGILADEHGLDLRTVDWVAAIAPRVPIPMPEGAKIRYIQADENLSDLLDSGQVDALLTHQVPKCFAQNSPRVRRVFADYVQAERDFYRRTKLHPIMHCAVLRRDIHERHRWALRSLYDALCDARDHAAKEILKTGTLSAMVPFLPHAMDDAREMFGENWWPYGLEANYECLTRMTRYAHEQALTPRIVAPEELFGDSVR